MSFIEALSDDEDAVPKDDLPDVPVTFVIGGKLAQAVTPMPPPEPMFIGSDSSSSGDERRQRLAHAKLVSGRRRTAAQERAIIQQRVLRMAELDAAARMEEMDQADLVDELGEERMNEIVDDEEVRTEWDKVLEERRKPAIEQKKTANVKLERTGWIKPTKPKDAVKRKRKKKTDAAKKRKAVTDTQMQANAAADELEAHMDIQETGSQSIKKAKTASPEKVKRTGGAGTKRGKQLIEEEGKVPILRYLADFARTCVCSHLWNGSQYQPHPGDTEMISVILPNANAFLEAGKEFGDALRADMIELFGLYNNPALQQVVEGIGATVETHLQPTVRKAPSNDTVDVWTGKVLVHKELNKMSALVYNPGDTDPESTPCSVIMSKPPATPSMPASICFLQ